MKVLSMIREKQLHVTYIKIRGHSGDIYNDIVDRLAKDAHLRSQLDNIFKSNSTPRTLTTFQFLRRNTLLNHVTL